MKKKEPLSPKEENFCRFFVASREPRASAARAGYSLHPERTAIKLLAEPEIKRRIAKLENERDAKLAEVTEGYRRLAFGSVADAIRLVSDIKCPKSGGIEVKFFDRLKALDRLCELSNAASVGESPDFLTALERSARALRGGDDERE